MLLTSLIYRSSSDSQACRDHWAFCMQIFPEILQGVPVQPYVRRYSPPSDEFEVDCCFVPPGEVVVISSAPSLSIFLVLTGEGDIQVDSMLHGEKAKEGDVFFVPSNTEVKLSACVHASMQLYRAGVSSNPCMSVTLMLQAKRSQLESIYEITS
jgi:mannose-6-phosphate isomerase